MSFFSGFDIFFTIFCLFFLRRREESMNYINKPSPRGKENIKGWRKIQKMKIGEK